MDPGNSARVSLDEFVKHQGTAMGQWYRLGFPSAISDNGTTIAAVGTGYQFYGRWVLDGKKVFVCHATSGNKPHTLSVAFPKAFDQHPSEGDTTGRCQ